MIKKIVGICCYFILLAGISKGEDTPMVMGRVLDASTGEQLVFVNIGIQGTLLGVASNYRGEFVLTIPDENRASRIYFSAIGYKNRTIPVSQLLNDRVNEIYMEPLSYGIEDIDVSAESKVLYRVLRDAIHSVSKNYLSKAHNYLVLYRCESFLNQTPQEKRDALVLTWDENGYGRTDDAFAARTYRFQNVIRNFQVESLEQGTTNMDELLELDLVRSPQNILDPLFLNEYDLELAGHDVMGNDSVWVIAYRLSKPELSRTGDFYASSYQGKVSISKTDYALLKNETHIKSTKNSPFGRSVIPSDNRALLQVDYTFTCTYQRTGEGCCLKSIELSKNYFDRENINGQLKASLTVLSVNTKQPETIEKREYYEERVSDHDFWIQVNQLLEQVSYRNE
ncbi:MAG TPA: carboxypeptidase-like regulatory domain-containing protein [Prolixibacteraceae bacterium]|nr:carboxypeptidase-like regulatory domain-containing protein [Prolixibacteraceae bacterium]